MKTLSVGESLGIAKVISDKRFVICQKCGGNDKDMPCAYPSENKEGCLRDKRLGVMKNDPTDTKCICIGDINA